MAPNYGAGGLLGGELPGHMDSVETPETTVVAEPVETPSVEAPSNFCALGSARHRRRYHRTRVRKPTEIQRRDSPLVAGVSRSGRYRGGRRLHSRYR